MDHTAHAQELLASLSSLFGAEALVLDEDGLCHLQHETGFTVTLVWQGEEAGAFTISSDVAEIPAHAERQSLYARLLRLNFLLIETGGATLCIDEDERFAFLCRELPVASMNDLGFIDAVTDFMVQAAQIRGQLQQTSTAEGSSPSFDAFSQHAIRS